ncbi:unnamed protein product [Rotaria magnacalcarata]
MHRNRKRPCLFDLGCYTVTFDDGANSLMVWIQTLQAGINMIITFDGIRSTQAPKKICTGTGIDLHLYVNFIVTSRRTDDVQY